MSAVKQGIIDIPDKQEINVGCKLTCYRAREVFKSFINVDCYPQKKCGEPSCEECLAQLKAAKHALLTGQSVAEVQEGDKRVVYQRSSVFQMQQLDAAIRQKESECGDKRKLCPPKKTKPCSGCGHNPGCGCGCMSCCKPCVNGRARALCN